MAKTLPPKEPPKAARDIATRDVLLDRLSGYDYAEIAERRGLPKASSEQLVDEAIARAVSEVDALSLQAYMYSVTAWRLLWNANEPGVIRGDDKALERGTKLLERFAKMTGSDRATPAAPGVGNININIAPVETP